MSEQKKIPSIADIEKACSCSIITREEADRLIEEAKMMTRQKLIKEIHGHECFESGGYWMTYVSGDNGKRKRVKRRRREDLEDWIIKTYGPEKEEKKEKHSQTVEEVFFEWNDSRLKTERVMGSTYHRDKQFFDKYFGGTEFVKTEMEATTAEEWAAYIQRHFDSGLTARQWGGIRGIVHGMYKYARRAGLIAWHYDDMMDLVDMRFVTRKQHEDADEILYPDELAALRRYCLSHWGPHERCIWLTTYTGTRIGEGVAFKPEDVDLGAMTITVQRRETKGDDQGRPRIVIRDGAKTHAGIRQVVLPPSISDEVRDIVAQAERHGWEYLFCGRGGQRLSAETVRRRLRKIELEELEMTKAKPPHKLRKTVASILLDSGKLTDKQVTAQLGHTNIKTTHDHYDKDRTTIVERSARLNEINEMCE